MANVYLHWFDTVVHRQAGPAQWAKARLVRYADDCVSLARRQSASLIGCVEAKVEDGVGLKVNRDKTRVGDLAAAGASLNFLGCTVRYDRDRRGRGHRYLNVVPSAKALARERAVRRGKTSYQRACLPLPALGADLNRHRQGWANYFRYGYPRAACRAITRYVQCRVAVHLGRRSQRPFRPPQGVTL